MFMLKSCLACCMFLFAGAAGAVLPFHDSFVTGVQSEWFPTPNTTLTLTTPAGAGIAAPAAPFDGQVGKLTTTSTFNPTTFAGGDAYVDWPYANHVNYTLSCRFYVPAATAGTTGTLGFIFYNTYKSSSGSVLLQYSPAIRLSVEMATFPVAYYGIFWQAGTDFPVLAAPAWHTLQVVLYGRTAQVLLDGKFVGSADWTAITNNGVIGGYGVEHSMISSGTHIPALTMYIDEFHATPTANTATDWALFQ